MLHKAPPLEHIYFYFLIKINCWIPNSSSSFIILHNIFSSLFGYIHLLLVIDLISYSTLPPGGKFTIDIISRGGGFSNIT